VYFATPLTGFSLEFGIGSRGQKNQNDWVIKTSFDGKDRVCRASCGYNDDKIKINFE